MNPNQARIDPELRDAIIAFHHPSIPVLREMPVEEARDFLELFVQQNPQSQVEVGAVRDIAIDAGTHVIPARLYLPPDRPGPHPVLVWFHGGGWVFGSVDGADADVRKLCRNTGAAVLSVDYRLAPEHRHPAAVEDALTAMRWVHREGAACRLDAGRIAVGGDSAGGNLAAICAIDARDQGTPELAAQFLVYPVVDDDLDRASYRDYAEGLLLETADMGTFWDHYCPEHARRRHWTVTPLNASSHAGLAPTVLMIADLDPLRSENEAYAETLEGQDVEVQVVRMRNLTHGAFGMSDNSRAAHAAIARACAMIAVRLGTKPLDD
ncbi:MAG: alpha/beta hydrolase [Phycisphaerales bacterium]|nr:alpha/beta hydrolase [Phycisphaerales bacterium]